MAAPEEGKLELRFMVKFGSRSLLWMNTILKVVQWIRALRVSERVFDVEIFETLMMQLPSRGFVLRIGWLDYGLYAETMLMHYNAVVFLLLTHFILHFTCNYDDGNESHQM